MVERPSCREDEVSNRRTFQRNHWKVTHLTPVPLIAVTFLKPLFAAHSFVVVLLGIVILAFRS